MATSSSQHVNSRAAKSEDKIMFLVAYLVPVLTGIIVYVLYSEKDRELRFHAVQSILYGIAFIVAWYVLSAVLFALFFLGGLALGAVLDIIFALAWLYGLYIGYEGFMGRRRLIPVLGNIAKEA